MKNKIGKLMSAFDHIDSRFIGEAMEFYGEKTAMKTSFAKKTNRFIAAASAAAACLLLVALVLSSVLIRSEQQVYNPSDLPAESNGVEVVDTPESDGTVGMLYEVREDGKTARFVSFGSSTEETVVIASTYDGLPVVEMIMGPYWDHRNSGGYVKMAESSKYGSVYVKNLIISDTVEIFDDTILKCCPNLESVYIGAKVGKMRSWGFSSGEFEKVVKLEVSPENETYMSSGNCIIEKATGTLFRGCETSVIPADGSVKIIGADAFFGVIGLTSIEIPESVTAIERQAFAWTGIESIVLPAGLKKMGNNAFMGCMELVSVDLNGFTVIPAFAFDDCVSLKEVNGSENIVEIGQDAFFFCTDLESITFSTALKKIGATAFYACKAEIVFEGTQAEWNSIELHEKWNGHTDADCLIKKVICTDGEFVPVSLPLNK